MNKLIKYLLKKAIVIFNLCAVSAIINVNTCLYAKQVIAELGTNKLWITDDGSLFRELKVKSPQESMMRYGRGEIKYLDKENLIVARPRINDFNSSLFIEHRVIKENLLIMSEDGNIKSSLDWVLSYDVNANDNQIAVSRVVVENNQYKNYQLPYTELHANVLGIFNPINGKYTELYKEDEGNFIEDVRWSQHDGNIYLRRLIKFGNSRKPGVFMFDINNATLIPTPYPGLIISPDGNFCIAETYGDGSRIALYNIKLNESVQIVSEDANDHLLYSFVKWGFENNKTFAFFEKLSSAHAGDIWKLDCETGKFRMMLKVDGINMYLLSLDERTGKVLWAKVRGSKVVKEEMIISK